MREARAPRIGDVSAGAAFVTGREHELQRALGALRGVIEGSGGSILIAGEPGIGKTLLAEAIGRRAKEHGASVAWGRCWEGEGAPDLWPWLQILRSCLRAVDDDALRALVGPHGSELTGLVSPLRPQHPDTSAPPESPAARFRQFNAIVHFLDGYARRTPLVLILDDLHRADPQSLLLLQFFTQEQRERPILLIGAYRDPGAPPNRALTQTLVEATREPGTERIVLRGLNLTETGALLRAMVDVEPQAGFIEALQQWTDGNPFLLSECGRAMLVRDDRGVRRLPESAAHIPISPEVRERVEQRLAPLSTTERQALRIAARLGREFQRSALDAELHTSGVFESATGLTSALETAERLRLVVHGPEPGRYRFAQGIVCSVLRTELSGVENARQPAAAVVAPTLPPPRENESSGQGGGGHVFRREGEYWTIAFAGRTCRVKDTKGLAYVAFLLRHAGRSVHATELLHLGAAGNGTAARPGQFDEGLATRLGLGDAGVVLDRRAKAEYRQRLADLHAELEQARAFNDAGRAERAQNEIDSIASELAGAVGLGGRDRRVGSDAERARVNVARSIARVLEKLRETHPELARHLSQSIRTGVFCTYIPDASITGPWDC